MSVRVLYISYDGMTDPLGQSQVLPYLKLLSKKGFSFTLLSFEKELNFKKHKEEIIQTIAGHDINWIPLSYTKKPPILSTLKDIRKGWKKINELLGKTKHDIVHCRGYVPALLGLRTKNKFGTKFIFDMRGWWADEKLESGNWKSPVYKPIYRYFKRKEKEIFRNCDRAISLTHAGKKYITESGLKKEDTVAVIPTCVDFSVFRSFDEETRVRIRKELGIPLETPVLLYSGSLGGNYRNDLVFEIFKSQLKRHPSSALLILSQNDRSYIDTEAKKYGIASEKIFLKNCRFSEMSNYLMAGDAGLIFYDDQFSSIGRSPTKLGEYWASGLPFIAQAGIGDLDLLFEKYPGASFLLKNYNDAEFLKALEAMLPASGISKKMMREYALDQFDINKGVEIYTDVYAKALKA